MNSRSSENWLALLVDAPRSRMRKDFHGQRRRGMALAISADFRKAEEGRSAWQPVLPKSLLISDIFPPKTGGSGRWFWEVYRRLPREQIVVAAGEDPRQEAFDRTHDLRISRLPLTLPCWGLSSLQALKGYWRGLLALNSMVRRTRARVVHCGRCLPEGLMGLALKYRWGLPYICYVHGEEINYASTSRELGWLLRRVLTGAAFVIANSRNTVRLLREEWQQPAQRVHLLYP